MRSFPGTLCQFTAYTVWIYTLYDSTLLHIDVAHLLFSQNILSTENLLVTKVCQRICSVWWVSASCIRSLFNALLHHSFVPIVKAYSFVSTVMQLNWICTVQRKCALSTLSKLFEIVLQSLFEDSQFGFKKWLFILTVCI